MNAKDALIALDKFIKPFETAREALKSVEGVLQDAEEAKVKREAILKEVAALVAKRDELVKVLDDASVRYESSMRSFQEVAKQSRDALDRDLAAARKASTEELQRDVDKLKGEQRALSDETAQLSAQVVLKRAELKQLQETIDRLKSSVANLS